MSLASGLASLESVVLEARTHIRQLPLLRGPWLRALAVGALCLLLGMLLASQFRTRTATGRSSTAAGSSPMAVISALVEANDGLRQERASLETQVEEYDRTSGQDRLTSLVEELKRLRIANGLAEVTGPGVEVHIEGSVSPLEMQDLVNELRNAGAEAIAVNGQRLVPSSVVASSGDTLLVDGESLTPPYVLEAIGDPRSMDTALMRQGGLIMLLVQAHDGLSLKVAQQARMVLAVYTRPLEFQYAGPAEQQE